MSLSLHGVAAGYGDATVIREVSLEVPDGAVVALLGRNGAGKSTTLKTIVGLVPPRAGEIVLDGARIDGRPAHVVNRRGIAYVPEERRIFSELTVDEHLLIAQRPNTPWPLDRIFALFPQLHALRRRRGRFLSGGEQQMLAIARALVTGPKLLLLDEPSQGLAPVIVDAVIASVHQMRAEGLSILLVEQDLSIALHLAAQVYILETGEVVYGGSAADLQNRDDLQAKYLGVG
ncbi:MAG: ABC transporter ATP-binding protein [Candidatus Eremiobacteraeota bacterium]|nr:ABC transporter ATP-binding protein [Candidatus Eremiobacteraeota bacterium]